MNRKTNVSRRGLIQCAAAAVAAPYVLTSDALGAADKPAASERIVLGAVGVGGQGSGNLRNFLGRGDVQVVAVCDVDAGHARRNKDRVDSKYGNTDCVATGDYREITRRADIDALSVATPDHWHVPVSIDAVRNGKDVYCEKPLTLTIREGRRLAEAAKDSGCIVQTGSQQRSSANFRLGCELVRNGRIGTLQRVKVGIPGNNKRCEPTWRPQPVPEGLDYDRWLGPAPWAPYHSQRCHYQFRFILDYSGGQVTNWGAHHLDIGQWGIGADETGPVQVTGNGQFPTSGLFTTATRVDFTCTYANGVVMTCKTGGSGTLFEGTEGKVYVNRGALRTEPASLAKDVIGPDEIHLYESRSHSGNFIDCIRSRRQPICSAEVGHRSSTVCHLGNIAMLLGRTLTWDPKTETFPGDDEAQRMTWRPARSPYAW